MFRATLTKIKSIYKFCFVVVQGHLVCSDCFPRLPHCPTCRSAMSAERNLGMEQVSRLLNFPCRYHPMGCKVAEPLNKKGLSETTDHGHRLCRCGGGNQWWGLRTTPRASCAGFTFEIIDARINFNKTIILRV